MGRVLVLKMFNVGLDVFSVRPPELLEINLDVNSIEVKNDLPGSKHILDNMYLVIELYTHEVIIEDPVCQSGYFCIRN